MTKLPRWFILTLIVFVLSLLAYRILTEWQSGRVVTGFVQDPSQSLKRDQGRTQIALLGIGGKGHAGGDLTDSMIVFSYNYEERELTLIPLPRDIWVPSLAAKINTAYHYGNEQGIGTELVKTSMTEVVGLPIHYVLVLDFAGFERMIDSVGGIDLVVERSFTDYKYPIPGKEDAVPESLRYEQLQFTAGPTHLDGATALKFARSRNSEGEEGTDFARSRRQELVINAFKDKLLSSNTFLNFTTLDSLRRSLSDSIITDLSDQELGSLIRLFIGTARGASPTRTLDLSNQFINPKDKSPYLGQWVLVPLNSFTQLHQYVEENL